jgi:hypothetical protein
MNAKIATSNEADRNGSACASTTGRGNVSGAPAQHPFGAVRSDDQRRGHGHSDRRTQSANPAIDVENRARVC